MNSKSRFRLLLATVLLALAISLGVIVPSGIAQAETAADREALVALYNSTGGAGWTNKDGWLTDTPIGQWHGVTTDSSGRVTVLNLAENKLTGTIPTQLGNLTNLTELVLWDNRLSGGIPAQLGSLTELTELNLGLNQLTGPVPSWLGSMANLEKLYLWGNELDGQIPTQLSSLSNLTALSLGANKLTGQIPTQFGSLSNLQTLSLGPNRLTGPVPTWLGSLSGLQVLSLWGNQLSGEIPSELGSLSNLTTLRLNNNLLTGEIPSSLADPSKLQELRLRDNRLTGCIPSGLQGVADNDLAELGLPFCGGFAVAMRVSGTSTQVRIGSPIQVTATFSGAVSGFTVDDVRVASGSASNFAGDDGDSVYTFDVLPNAIGAVTVDIPENAAVYAGGNGNTAAVQLSLGLPYDDNHDGRIQLDEAIAAVSDYFSRVITIEHAIAVVNLYVSSL